MSGSPTAAETKARAPAIAERPPSGSAGKKRRDEAPAVNARSLIAILWRRKLPFMACVLVIPACALIAINRITTSYTATGTLVYEPSEFRPREMQSLVRVDPITEAVMATQAEILQGLHIAQKVTERGQLDANPEFNRALNPPSLLSRIARWIFPSGEAEPTGEPPPGPQLNADRDATFLAVQAALHAATIRYSHAIAVTFTARDPLVAAAAVNNAMDVYVKDQFAAKARIVRNDADRQRRRADELRQEMRRAEDAIADYRAKHRLFQGMHADSDAEQLSHLTEDLVRARGELAAADAKLDAVRARAGAGALAAIAPSVVQLRLQQDELAAKAKAQQARLGFNHPEAAGLRHQNEEAQRAVAAETARVVAAIEAERHAARNRVATLEENLRAAQLEADRAAQAQIPLNAMLRDAEAARTELNAVLGHIQQTAQQAAIETAEAHEISQALPPEHPSWPRPLPMMAAAIASSVLLGLILVYVLHLADTTVNSGDDARASTSLPCFALLPEVGRRALGHIRIVDYVTRRPLTAFAEQIRTLRAGLWLGAHRPRVVAVTAARPSEGKTLLTLALGRSARMSGERVLLIECDLRQPKFAHLLSGDGGPGLAALLKGEIDLDQALREDPLTGLSYIPAGTRGNDVLGLFLSEAMGQLLSDVRAEYDLVLLDAPPVQAMSEARAVAAIADATLLCVRWRSTPRAVLRHAMELLEETHAHVIGTVLTRVDPRAHVRSGYTDAEVYHRRYRPYFQG